MIPNKQTNRMETTYTINNYQPRTLKSSSLTSRRRRSLLPAYPAHKYDVRPSMLLLANVPNIDRDLIDTLSSTGDIGGENFEFCPFKFEPNQDHEFIQSFLIDFYQKLYIDTSHGWKMSLSLIDYNLTRLRQCMDKYSRQVGEAAITSIDELPVALEFYLQIDVDLFFMKTCHFRDAQPRLIGNQKEGLLCQAEPYARYGTMPCSNTKCFLCKSERIALKQQKERSASSTIDVGGIKFSEKQMYRFLNGYAAILNCPAHCDTENIIYALTCPCGEYDYIGSTGKSFCDRIQEHREEGHRIIREFLIGPQNVNHILSQDKRKVEPLANKYDQLLYQHSARCRYGLNRFLDKNPNYWSFIPQLCRSVEMDNKAYLASKEKNTNNENNHAATGCPFSLITAGVERTDSTLELLPSTPTGKPTFFAALVSDMVRSKEETQQLVRDVPDPPKGYKFSIRQRIEQTQLFQTKKENHAVPSDFVDLYLYSIVAVLPIDCSRHLRKFIEALFVTHTEAKLNLIGRLTHKHPDALFDSSIRGDWCAKLVHPSFDNDEIEEL